MNGLTLPNRQWDTYTLDEVSALYQIKPDILLFFLYEQSYQQMHNLGVIQQYVQQYPTTRLIARFYGGSEWTYDPVSWGISCASRYLSAKFILRQDFEVIPANEADIESHLTPDEQVAWLTTWMNQFKDYLQRHAPYTHNPVLHCPALSPAASEANYQAYATFLQKTLIIGDIHAYGENALDIVNHVASIYDQPPYLLFVSEYNQINPLQFIPFLHGIVSGACYFILGGTPDQAKYNLLFYPDYIEAMKRL